MVMTYILFVVGIYLLVRSADWIVDGASSLAKKLGVSSLIIGLTVVAFGTSLPELVVNLFAALEGNGEIAFGNIVGSNIANVLLVLGVTAMITNVKVKSNTVWKEIPFALLAAFALFALTSKIFFGSGHFLNWFDGVILLGLFGVFLVYVFRMAFGDKKKIDFPEDSDEGNLAIVFSLVAGLVGIYFGGRWVVEGAILIASNFGLSEYLISATVIAIGTSLPELVVCVIAALKKNVDLAVGNVIGSNIFNVLWVLGIVPIVAPIRIPDFIGFDIGIMFLSTLILFVFMFTGKKRHLSLENGAIFVFFYVLYISVVVLRG
jgi:cation:H+ antiporter